MHFHTTTKTWAGSGKEWVGWPLAEARRRGRAGGGRAMGTWRRRQLGTGRADGRHTSSSPPRLPPLLIPPSSFLLRAPSSYLALLLLLGKTVGPRGQAWRGAQRVAVVGPRQRRGRCCAGHQRTARTHLRGWGPPSWEGRERRWR